MADPLSAISFAVRGAVVLKYLSQLLFILAILNLVPLTVAIFFEEYQVAQRYLIIIGVCLAGSLPYRWIPKPKNLQENEAMTIIALAFIVSPFLATISFTGSGIPFSDALFEAVSAVTTTGLSTLPDPQQYPKTFQFARSWMQWYGGLGIVIFSLAFLMGHHSTARKFVESLGGENLITTAQTYARQIFFIYTCITLIAVLAIVASSGDLLFSVIHGFSAVSTGGFSNLGGSLMDVEGWAPRLVVTLGCLVGALPLVVYYQMVRGDWQRLKNNYEILVFLISCTLFCVYLAYAIHTTFAVSWQDAVFHGIAMGVSAQSTAGFTTINIDTLADFPKMVMMLAMFIGGSVGSTSGGAKILHIIIFFRLLQIAFQKATLPAHAVWEYKLQRQVLSEADIIKVLMLIIAFVFVIFISWGVFLWYGYPPVNALFEVISATMTVGLSVGITHAELEAPLKWLLCLNMWLGRVEIFAMLILLYPRNWIGRKAAIP